MFYMFMSNVASNISLKINTAAHVDITLQFNERVKSVIYCITVSLSLLVGF